MALSMPAMREGDRLEALGSRGGHAEGYIGRAEEGRRHRGTKRFGPAEVVQAGGMAAPWSTRLTAIWHSELSRWWLRTSCGTRKCVSARRG
jgi:hypothetical protein